MVTVVIPVYNVEKYIERCIESIIAQTYTDIEIILVDDGSTDGSGKICDKYADLDSRIIVLHQKNQGLSGARNAGIDIARGEYITFVDSDDFVHVQMIEILLNAIIEDESQISICSYEVGSEDSLFFADSTIRVHTKIYSGRELLLYPPNNMAINIACAKLYNKKLFENVRYPVGKLHEDDFVTYKLLYGSAKVSLVMVDLYYYYQRENSITSQRVSIRNFSYLEAILQQAEFYKKKEEPELQKKYVSYILEKFFLDYLFGISQQDRKNDKIKNYFVLFERLLHEYTDNTMISKKTRLKYCLFYRFPRFFERVYRLKSNLGA